jgi:hypothetical protein
MSAMKTLAVALGSLTAAIALGASCPVPPPATGTDKGGFEWGIGAHPTTVVDQTQRTS